MVAANGWIDRNLSRITLVCVFGTCLCFVGLGVLNAKVRSQSAQGSAARVTQCKVRPATIKKEQHFSEIGVLTVRERNTDIAALPSRAECVELLSSK